MIDGGGGTGRQHGGGHTASKPAGARFKKGEAGEMARRLSDRARDVCHWLWQSGEVVGHEFRTGDVFGAAGHSLNVRLVDGGGKKRAGTWIDNNNGDHHGDLLNAVYYRFQCSTLGEAMEIAAEWLDGRQAEQDYTETAEAVPAKDRSSQEVARYLWRISWPFRGSLAERYFEHRGFKPLRPDWYRFLPNAKCPETGDRRPIVLYRVQDPTGDFVGVQRVFLNEDGTKADYMKFPKRALGPVADGAIWHAPPAAVQILAEGGEDGLALQTAMPKASVWSAVSGPHIIAFRPHAALRTLIIARQNDNTGEWSAARLPENLAASGRSDIRVITHVSRSKDHDLDIRTFGAEAVADGFRQAYRKAQ